MPIARHGEFASLHALDHPLAAHKLTLLRDKTTSPKIFRELVNELTLLLAYEATSHLPTQSTTVTTPLQDYEAQMLTDKHPVVVPILRAGLGMVEGILQLLPTARVGHIGLYRDEETAKPQQYYFKLPKGCQDSQILLVDPMLATGGSSVKAIDLIKAYGCKHITLLCIIAAPEGVATVTQAHPDVSIYAGALDQCLNEHNYILPGLGDAGDRLYASEELS